MTNLPQGNNYVNIFCHTTGPKRNLHCTVIHFQMKSVSTTYSAPHSIVLILMTVTDLVYKKCTRSVSHWASVPKWNRFQLNSGLLSHFKHPFVECTPMLMILEDVSGEEQRQWEHLQFLKFMNVSCAVCLVFSPWFHFQYSSGAMSRGITCQTIYTGTSIQNIQNYKINNWTCNKTTL